jgi:hypothetical protein
MSSTKRQPPASVALAKLFRELECLVGNKVSCPECDVSLSQLLRDHLEACHNRKIDSLVDETEPVEREVQQAEQTEHPAERGQTVTSVSFEPLEASVNDFVDVTDGEGEKQRLFGVLKAVEECLPEISVEARLEIDESENVNQESGSDDSELGKSLRSVESLLDRVDQLYSAPSDREWIFLSDEPPCSENRVISNRDDERANDWLTFVESLRSGPRVEVRERLISLKEKYKCDVCGSSFPKRSLLLHHVAKHERVGIKRCGVCSKLSEIPEEGSLCSSCLDEVNVTKRKNKIQPTVNAVTEQTSVSKNGNW